MLLPELLHYRLRRICLALYPHRRKCLAPAAQHLLFQLPVVAMTAREQLSSCDQSRPNVLARPPFRNLLKRRTHEKFVSVIVHLKPKRREEKNKSESRRGEFIQKPNIITNTCVYIRLDKEGKWRWSKHIIRPRGKKRKRGRDNEALSVSTTMIWQSVHQGLIPPARALRKLAQTIWQCWNLKKKKKKISRKWTWW